MATSKVIPVSRFSRIRNDIASERLPADELVDAINVDLDDAGALRRRDGVTPIANLAVDGEDPGNLHSIFAIQPDTLLLRYSDRLGSVVRGTSDFGDVLELASGLSIGTPMSYVSHNGLVYMSDGVYALVTDGREARKWGIDPPLVAAQATGGELPAGTYLVTATYQDSAGRESGALLGVPVDLPSGGGIVVSVPVGGYRNVLVYCTTANGETMYEAAGGWDDGSDIVISGSTLDFQRPLSTLFYGPAPAGDVIAIWRGHAFIAAGNLVYYSAPFGLEWFRGDQFWAFDSAVTMIAPAEDGLYIGTQTQTLWMAGLSPSDMTVVQRHDQGAVKGSQTFLPIMAIKDQQGEHLAPAWLSTEGLCAGLPGGILLNLTEQWKFTAPERAASLFRRRTDGGFQLLSSFIG